MNQLCPFIAYLQFTAVSIDLSIKFMPIKIDVVLSTTDSKSTFAVRYWPFRASSYSHSNRFPIEASIDGPITELNYQFIVYLRMISTYWRATYPKNAELGSITGSWAIDVLSKTGVVVSGVTSKMVIDTKTVNLTREYIIEIRDGNCTIELTDGYSPSTTVTSGNKFRSTCGMTTSRTTECANRNESNFPFPSVIVIVILVVILMLTIRGLIEQSQKIRATETKAKKKEEKKPNQPKMIPYDQDISQYATTQYCDSLTMESSKTIFGSTSGMPFSKQHSTMRTNGKQTMWNLKKVGQKKATQNNDMKTMSSLTKKGQSKLATIPLSVSKSNCYF